MSTSIILVQMLIIFALIVIGAILYKLQILNDEGSKQISGLIVNVTNPALLFTSCLSSDSRLSTTELIMVFMIFLIMHLLLIAVGYIIPPIIGIKKDDRYHFKMMSVFGNVGFIGIPLTAAILGNDALIYVAICNLVYSFVFYTYGITVMKNAAIAQGKNVVNNSKIPGWINVGTISGVITVVLYVLGVQLTSIPYTTLDYIGRCTTFLSMLVLGVSVATMNVKEVFLNVRLYIFLILRLLVIPVLVIPVFRLFIESNLLINTITLMITVSCGNMPLMIAKNNGIRDNLISGGIILSVILSLVTIPLATYLLSLI